MSLETVVDDIRETARERAEAILEEANAEADRIVAAAERDAEEIVAEAEADVERQIARERDQRRSSATLEAKQSRLAARRDQLAAVRAAAADALADLAGERREALTRELLEAAIREFEDADEISVYGARADAELIDAILADAEGAEYAGEIDCLGGVVVESASSRLRVNNTFDSLLETVWDEELRRISDRLFER